MRKGPATTLGEAPSREEWWARCEWMREQGWAVSISAHDDVLTPSYHVRVRGPRLKAGRWGANATHRRIEAAVDIAYREALRARERFGVNGRHPKKSSCWSNLIKGDLHPQAQRCKRCGRADGIDFHVSDEEWDRIAGPYNVLCLWCFDSLARDMRESYSLDLLCFAGRAGSFYQPKGVAT